MRGRRKLFLLAAAALLPAGSGWCDVTLLRDQVLSSDPAVVDKALQEVDALPPQDKQLLASGLLVALHQNPVSAQAAAKALAHCPKEAEHVVPDLVDALSYDEPEVAATVGDTLIKIGPASVPALARALGDLNFIVRQRAATILGGFGPAALPAASALVVLLLDAHYDVQSAAEGALLKIGEPAVPAVAGVLRESDADGRRILVTFLGRLGPAATPVLLRTLRTDENPFVCISAAAALAGIRPVAPEVVPALVDRLKNPDDNLRRAAIEALSQLGADAKAAIGPLIVASRHDSEAYNRQKGAQALDSIGPGSKESLPGLIQALKDDDAGVRTDIVTALGQAQVPADEAMSLLTVALKDPDTGVRLQAVQVAGALCGKEAPAVSVLKSALGNSLPEVRAAAVKALGECVSSPESAAQALESVILKDQDPVMRDNGIKSLGRLGPAAVPVLLLELMDSYGSLAEEAAQTIVRMGSDAIPILEKAKPSSGVIIQGRIPALIEAIQNSHRASKQ